MFEDIKKLKRLRKRQEGGNTSKELRDEIEEQTDKVVRYINGFGWILVFSLILPTALTGTGISIDMAGLFSFLTLVVVWFGVWKITGRLY